MRTIKTQTTFCPQAKQTENKQADKHPTLILLIEYVYYFLIFQEKYYFRKFTCLEINQFIVIEKEFEIYNWSN